MDDLANRPNPIKYILSSSLKINKCVVLTFSSRGALNRQAQHTDSHPQLADHNFFEPLLFISTHVVKKTEKISLKPLTESPQFISMIY